MKALKQCASVLALVGLGIVVMACSGPGPSDSDEDTSTQHSETGQTPASDSDPASSSPQTVTQEATESGSLPIDVDKLQGYWQARGGSSDDPPYIYHFQEGGSLTVYQGEDNAILEGSYQVTGSDALRLDLRDPKTGESKREMTLRLMVRKGHAQYAFEVQPDGSTLWLRRVKPESRGPSSPD